MLTNRIIILFGLLGVLLTPMAANATCCLLGYPIRVTTYPDRTYIMFRTSKFNTYYYQGYSSESRVESGMWTALKGSSKTLIRGSRSSCPSIIGPGKYDIGVIDRIGTGY